MRVVSVRIASWRNFENVHFQVPKDVSLVCLVGENGTGKSNLLELISAVANQTGLASGLDLARGNPLAEDHDIEVVLEIPEELRDNAVANLPDRFHDQLEEWNGLIGFESRQDEHGNQQSRHFFPNLGDNGLSNVARRIPGQLQNIEEIHHLYLDSDRSYPPVNVQDREIIRGQRQEWDSYQWRRQWAHRQTNQLYQEWIKYFLARESQEATQFYQEMRRAYHGERDEPEFEDPFREYRELVLEVLPHLEFAGADSDQGTILFDSTGDELKFSQLSGGEREIAFLVGQIDRFQLRRGLLLLDEPELHLNPDLVRNWVAFLRATIDEGQVWIATHSLEAAETTAEDSTFVFSRTDEGREVTSIEPLNNRPVIKELSSALGAPAFSLHNLRFCFIEGDRSGRERERFHHICGSPATNRFLEGGSCDEVLDKLAAVRELADRTDQRLRVGGIVDRDFRTVADIEQLEAEQDVLVLRVHEVENLLLHVSSLRRIIEMSGLDVDPIRCITLAADRFAGRWLMQRAAARGDDLDGPRRGMRVVAGNLSWENITDNNARVIDELVDSANADDEAHRQRWRALLQSSIRSYSELRNTEALSDRCFGKEVLNILPEYLDLSSADAIERRIYRLWEDQTVDRPDEIRRIIDYLENL